MGGKIRRLHPIPLHDDGELFILEVIYTLYTWTLLLSFLASFFLPSHLSLKHVYSIFIFV